MKKFLRTHKGGTLIVASFCGLSTESAIHNWVRRERIPKKKQELLQKLLQAKSIRLEVSADRDQIRRRWAA